MGGITSKSAVAACQADGATVQTAIAAYNNLNAGSTVTTAALTTAGSTQYLASWPNNTSHYTFSLTSGTLYVSTNTAGTAAVVYAIDEGVLRYRAAHNKEAFATVTVRPYYANRQNGLVWVTNS